MAGNRFKASASAITTGTSAKTLFQVIAASNHKVRIDRISLTFNGTSNTAEPILCRLIRQTTSGTMTGVTGKKDPDDWSETIQTTFSKDASAEPTTGEVIDEVYAHPQVGYIWPFPKGLYIGGGDRLGVVVTAAASVSASVTVDGEE